MRRTRHGSVCLCGRDRERLYLDFRRVFVEQQCDQAAWASGVVPFEGNRPNMRHRMRRKEETKAFGVKNVMKDVNGRASYAISCWCQKPPACPVALLAEIRSVIPVKSIDGLPSR